MKRDRRFALARNKQFVQFLLFFTLMFVAVLVLLGSFSYVYSKQSIDKNNERLYRSMMTNAKEAIESRLTNLNQTALFLLNDTRFQKLMLEQNLDNSGFDIFQVVNGLKGASFTSPGVEHISLYVAKADRVLTIWGLEMTEDYLNSVYSDRYTSFEQLLRNAPLWNHLYYLEPGHVNINNHQTKAMTLIRSASNNRAEIQAGALFLIDNSWLDDLLPRTNESKGSYAFIRDIANHTIIAGSSALPDNEDASTDYSFVFTEKINDMPWEMTMVFPRKSVLFLTEYTHAFVIVIAIFILAGLLLSFGLSFSNYRPMKRILRYIERPEGRTRERLLTDEYTLIRRYLDDEEHQTTMLADRMALYKEVYRETNLSRLLTGMPIGRQDFKQMSVEYVFPEHPDRLLVIAYQLVTDRITEAAEAERDQIRTTLLECVRRNAAHAYELEGEADKRYVLMCMSYEGQRKSLIDDLQASRVIFEAKNGVRCYVGVGTTVGSLNDVYRSCRQSVFALEFAASTAARQVVEYEAVVDQPLVAFPADVEANSDTQGADDIEHHVYRFIEANYCKPKLTLNYIAEQLNTSPYIITKSMGIDIQDYVNRKRIDFALSLLIESAHSISQISVMSGFANENVFIRVFKRYQGVTPGQYRKKR